MIIIGLSKPSFFKRKKKNSIIMVHVFEIVKKKIFML